MKTVIFSDTHLSSHFDVQKFDYLKNLFAGADRLIINGDFWDGYETSFAEFARSPWKDLFPLMRNKNAVYLYGNHDTRKWTDDPSLFSVSQSDRIVLQIGKKELYIEHGHRLAPSFDITYPKLAVFLRMFFSSRHMPFRASIRGFDNTLMKRFATKNLSKNQILVCGHSHIPEYNKHARYINTGFIDNGIASFLCIENKKLSLIMETYQEVL